MQQAGAGRRESSMFRSGAEQQSRLILQLFNVCRPFVYVQAVACRHHRPSSAPGDDPASAPQQSALFQPQRARLGPGGWAANKHGPYWEKRRGNT